MAALNDAIENKRGSQTELSRSTGLSLSKIHSYTTGTRSGTEDDRRAVAAVLGYPGEHYEEFLDIGRAKLGLPILRSKQRKNPRIPTVIQQYGTKLEKLYTFKSFPVFESATQLIDTLLQIAEKFNMDDTSEIKESPAIYDVSSPGKSIRYYESIAAGVPFAVESPIQMWITTGRDKIKDSWYALRVEGDSMEPDYKTGDIILMDQYQEPRNGSVVAALIDGAESTLKVYSRRKDEITLTPINKESYKPCEYHADRVSIQGVLIDLIKRKK